MALKNIYYCLFLLLVSGCIFSKDDIHECKLSETFYISGFDGSYTLLKKSQSDLNLVGTGTVVLENLDSIGMNKELIIAHIEKNGYRVIILDTFLPKPVTYNNYLALQKALQENKSESLSIVPIICNGHPK